MSASPVSGLASSTPSLAVLVGDGDAEARLQRLVVEYDKIRKQHAVLKKAVLAV
jgi:hypothetical protein